MNVQLKKGVLDICVLSLLLEKDYYGYELASLISGYIYISEGTIYPILRKLQVEAYLESYLTESKEGPARKYYRITEKGRDELVELYDEWSEFCKKVNLIIGRSI